MKYLAPRSCALLVVLATVFAARAAVADGPSAIALATPVSGTIAAAGEVDWYTVTFDTVGDLKVTQTVWPPYIETRIAVFGPNSQTLAQANPVAAAAPGTYYIKVWSATDGISADVYTFNATLTKATTGNDIDKGANGSAAPVVITLGKEVSDTIAPSKETAVTQDVDWYAVTTDTIGDLAVTQTVWPPYIETRIAIFGPNDPLVAQANPVSAAKPGLYFIKVWSATDGSSIAPYTFTAALTKATTGNDIDKGANSSTAPVAITLETAVSDTIAPSKATAGIQDTDWYTVTTTVLGDLTITQTAWPPYIETRFSVYGPNNPALEQSSPLNAAAPGTYYIKMWSTIDGSSIAPYTFKSTLVAATTGNDINQGKNAALGAVPITLGTPVTDTIGPSKATAGVQDVDWYSVTTTVAGELSVTQTMWPPYIETRIALFGPNDPALPLISPVKAAIPGIYYIKVWSATDGSSIAPYIFTTDLRGTGGVSLVDAGLAPDARGAGGASGSSDGGLRDAGSLVGIDAPIGRDLGALSDTRLGQMDGKASVQDSGADLVPGLVPADAGTGPGVLNDAGYGVGSETDSSGGCKSCNIGGQGRDIGLSAMPLLLVATMLALRRVRRRR